MESEVEFVTPGQRLGVYSDEYVAGNGTYVREQAIYASVVGYKQIMNPSNQNCVTLKDNSSSFLLLISFFSFLKASND